MWHDRTNAAIIKVAAPKRKLVPECRPYAKCKQRISCETKLIPFTCSTIARRCVISAGNFSFFPTTSPAFQQRIAISRVLLYILVVSRIRQRRTVWCKFGGKAALTNEKSHVSANYALPKPKLRLSSKWRRRRPSCLLGAPLHQHLAHFRTSNVCIAVKSRVANCRRWLLIRLIEIRRKDCDNIFREFGTGAELSGHK